MKRGKQTVKKKVFGILVEKKQKTKNKKAV